MAGTLNRCFQLPPNLLENGLLIEDNFHIIKALIRFSFHNILCDSIWAVQSFLLIDFFFYIYPCLWCSCFSLFIDIYIRKALLMLIQLSYPFMLRSELNYVSECSFASRNKTDKLFFFFFQSVQHRQPVFIVSIDIYIYI